MLLKEMCGPCTYLHYIETKCASGILSVNSVSSLNQNSISVTVWRVRAVQKFIELNQLEIVNNARFTFINEKPLALPVHL